jgi:hypothetical protein
METLGMTEEEMLAYLEELLREEAEEAAERNGTTPAQEMGSPGFSSARAATSYAIRIVAANNAFLARHLLDLGVLTPPDETAEG